ncbi:energy-coupling factor transporter transmembrane protein EcfT [Aestuariimicrobium sp. p3-SID1156]|uniref:energy-coupling factor transporter transmembrane component T family protein n=1 Tax=Aestuariimicrobium sp. p3-SID1156 TaxID=2916038 RepID=UPI00223B65CC|nr:energy-coupling factor transporter transmembrane component T [Aestuariimicrobium sp. p3-SID1156]MCT1458648.1 energy-coupling factor transporter transmembrane protein EcfT [Aestuariimicrobium sp. p3-SID1156]
MINRINPVTRLLLAILLSIPVIITLDWVSATVVFLSCLALAPVVGFPLRTIGTRLIPLLLVAPLGAISMALYGKPGGEVHFHWFLITISDQSVRMALAAFLRVFALGLPTILLFTTVDPTDMADGLAQVAKLPARFVLGTLAGVRMVGLFLDDWRSLEHARRARGLGDTGRLRRWFTMAFALMVFAVRRGSRLATAMEARGFGGNERTWARPSTVGWPDAIAVGVSIAIGAAALIAAWQAGTLWVIGS